MSNLLRKIFQNNSTRVLVLLFITLLLLISYFLTHSYYVQLDIHKSKILSRLQAVASTASSQIDPNQLTYLFDEYETKGAIETNSQNKVYQLIHEKLNSVQKLNQLNTVIYTLTYDSTANEFIFGVNSSLKPFFRHTYDNYPKELKENYTKGGLVDVYEDKNGHWLSAFAPIKDDEGNTVAVVQVDNRFDEFLQEARQEIFKNIGISLIITLIIIFFLVRSMRAILLKEDKLTAKLMQSKMQLEIKSQETLDSILYAKRIQEAILPLVSKIRKALPNSFIFHIPRDIVSGDFYWFKKIGNKIFIASVDCTGHGVPGAFMSMIGTILLDDIVEKKQVYKPDEILNELHKDVVKALKQNTREKASKDGMDIALCLIDKENEVLEFAGAFRPLIHIRDGKLNRIKSDSAPIGGFSGVKPVFTKHEIKYQAGDSFYIYSDGYPDQFGGKQNKKYMTKRFRDFLLEISSKEMEAQKELLSKEFEHWKGDVDQVDDVLVVGFKL